MVEHVAEFAPLHAKFIGPQRLPAVVRQCIARAADRGFSNRGPARLYLDLIFMFGFQFDTDPQLGWASAIVKRAQNQMDRAERLHAEALRYAKAVDGPDHEYSKEAYGKALKVRFEHLKIPRKAREAGCLGLLKSLYPQKCAEAGEPALRKLIREAAAQTQARSITSEAGFLLFLILMFLMGHGFATDPLFPWASDTLSNAALGESNKRAEKLYARAMLYLERVVANLR